MQDEDNQLMKMYSISSLQQIKINQSNAVNANPHDDERKSVLDVAKEFRRQRSSKSFTNSDSEGSPAKEKSKFGQRS